MYPQQGVDQQAFLAGSHASVRSFNAGQMYDRSKLLIGYFMSSHCGRGLEKGSPTVWVTPLVKSIVNAT